MCGRSLYRFETSKLAIPKKETLLRGGVSLGSPLSKQHCSDIHIIYLLMYSLVPGPSPPHAKLLLFKLTCV